ncbi:sulfite exporter TauE/SafE family protein [Bdellovibrionota bacterium]
MEIVSYPLIFTAISLAFIHTILGPDHYIPFVALSKSNGWTYKKTMIISVICGLAHCLSSVVIGLIGIALGIMVGKLEAFEGVRGDIASYLMISFGLVYLIWSVKRLVKGKKHSHKHNHGNLIHSHTHGHAEEHVHPHSNKSQNLFWGIFIVFLFGPCEPLIPLLMYPAAKSNIAAVIAVASTFTVVTVLTMTLMISLALKGLSFLSLSKLEKYAHPIAAVTIMICGILIVIGL